jgi:uroporphyrinogen-III synthase
VKFSGIVITRPRAEAEELAGMLATIGAKPIILPAFEFKARPLPAREIRELEQAAATQGRILLIFTSPRAVDFGLGQIPTVVIQNAVIGAIGPATAEVLKQAGAAPRIMSHKGYTSEDLLREVVAGSEFRAASGAGEPAPAFILAAPGGREALRDGLNALGFSTRMLMVYEREPAALEPEAIKAIEAVESLLVVWSSDNAMLDLQRRLPPSCRDHMLRAEWLVISERLASRARTFHPARVHQARGPSNAAILQAIQALD